MKKIAFFFSICVLALSVLSARGQGVVTGSITGTVQDPTGASIPSAQITATNVETGTVVNSVTNAKGDFTLSNVPIGTYKLKITAPNFGTLEDSNVQVQSGTANGLGIQVLQVGSTLENVEVSTASALLETVQSQVTTTFDTMQVADLPTGGGFDELALLIPGVVSTHANNRANTNGAGISSNGQRGRSNNFELDGQSNNDNSVTGPQIFMSNEDAIAEIQIITDNFSAQYGRDAGTVVNYITKNGTNAFHGSAQYIYEGSWLSSLTQGQKNPLSGYCAPGQTSGCVPVKKPRFDTNEWGGTLGGPILKDKLFGFGSAFFINTYNGISALYTSGTIGGTTGFIPNAAGLATLQTALPNNPGLQSLAKFGPQATGVGTFGYQGPVYYATVSDGVTTVPNVAVQQYNRTYSPHSTDEEVLGRLDYQATNRDRFFMRYFYQNDPSFLASGTVSTGAIVNVDDVTHSIGADWSHTFGPRVVNQIRYSFQQAKVAFEGGGFPNCTLSNLTQCPSSFSLSSSAAYKVPTTLTAGGAVGPAVSLSSFGLSTSYPQGRVVKDTQVQDNLDLNWGKHTITIGGSYEFQNSPNVFLPNISGAFTLNGFNGLLQDNGTLSLAYGNANVHFTEPDVAAYFQDDWKATPQLTLNLGVRWEFFASSINLLHNLSVANQSNPATQLWNPALPISHTTFPQVAQDYKHFEPRIGFTYNPAMMKSLVVRGGYAINIAPAYYNIFLNSYGSAPVVLSNSITGCNNTTKQCLPNGGATYTTVHAADNQYLLPAAGATSTLDPGNFSQTLVNPDFRQPITQTYSLGIQQQVSRIGVVEARYVGAHTSGDFQSINANPAIGAAVTAFPKMFSGVSVCTTAGTPGYSATNARINCANSNVRLRANTSYEIYNGLQTSFNTRNYKGLTANLSYTWSRTIDNASEIFGTFGGGATVAFSNNPLDPNVGERGVSGQSYPNVTTLGLVYIAPFFKENHGWMGRLLGGFQLNTIYVFNSGQPWTPYQLEEGSYCDNSFNTAFGSAVDSCRPFLANKNAPVGKVGYNLGNGTYEDVTATQNTVTNPTGATITGARSSFRYIFNTQAEALAVGSPYGGVGRNTERGTTYNNLDASLFKTTKLTERVNLQLRVVAFNTLNRAYYGSPDGELEDAGSTYGNVTGNGGSNRNVQVGAKVVF